MEDLIGRRLGKYLVLEEVGRGGMGGVFKAMDVTLDRTVALKVMVPHLAWEKAFVQRFRREAKTAAALEHPNIIAVYEVGEESGFHYLSMKFLEGQPLSGLLKKGPVPVQQVCDVVRQVASALSYAHSRGVMHRDVKPSNIILSPSGLATLTDFGIAKALEASGATGTTIPLGTPQYMAPEQVQGAPASPRSDIYCLGLVAYEMLAGRPAFVAETPLALVHKHVHEWPLPLSQLRPDLPQAVQEVLHRALAKDPDVSLTVAKAGA